MANPYEGAARVVEVGNGIVLHEAQVAEDDRTTIHYHFPVEVEVVMGPPPIDPQRIADLTLDRLARSLHANSI